MSWLARLGALAIGLSLWWIGISVAADVGEILVGTPLFFVGTVAVVFAVTGRRPPRFWRSSRSPTFVPSPDQQLHAEMSTLENELAASMQVLADLEARAAAAQACAVEAIRMNDDRAARTALLEQQAIVEKASVVTADLSVLRAILDECHEFEDRVSESPSPQQ